MLKIKKHDDRVEVGFHAIPYTTLLVEEFETDYGKEVKEKEKEPKLRRRKTFTNALCRLITCPISKRVSILSHATWRSIHRMMR